jgi:hypothetical protein
MAHLLDGAGGLSQPRLNILQLALQNASKQQ